MEDRQTQLYKAYINYVTENTTDNAQLYGGFLRNIEEDPEFADMWLPASYKKMFIKKYSFYREENGDWFIDLPEWTGSKFDLQMVSGADTMLDRLSDYSNYVTLDFSEYSMKGDDVKLLTLVNKHSQLLGGGADYLDDIGAKIWLCDVTKFVFGKFPKKIWLRVSSNESIHESAETN